LGQPERIDPMCSTAADSPIVEHPVFICCYLSPAESVGDRSRLSAAGFASWLESAGLKCPVFRSIESFVKCEPLKS